MLTVKRYVCHTKEGSDQLDIANQTRQFCELTRGCKTSRSVDDGLADIAYSVDILGREVSNAQILAEDILGAIEEMRRVAVYLTEIARREGEDLAERSWPNPAKQLTTLRQKAQNLTHNLAHVVATDKFLEPTR